jgi:hypothetical protein
VLRANLKALFADDCSLVVDRAPARVKAVAETLESLAVVHAVFDPILPALGTLRSDLEGVPTDDATLRAGRAALVGAVDVIGGLPPALDTCAELRRWRDTGWAPAAAPVIPQAVTDAFSDDAGGEAAIAAFSRRLRALGIGPVVIRRLTFEVLLDPIFDEAAPAAR